MIITNIIGGLGNQMFQHACGRALSIRTGQEMVHAIDQFKNYKLHQGFELQRIFRINTPVATRKEIRRLIGWRSLPTIRRMLGRPALSCLTGSNWVGEPHHGYWEGMTSIQGPKYLHGYWQSERYFKECSDQIRADFTFRMNWDSQDAAVRQRMRARPSASLHVRRGDYTLPKNQSIYALCDLDYYRKAIQLLRAQVPDVQLFAFSDHPDWVEAHLGAEFDFLETVRHNSGARSVHDMRLMSQADHHIIANSSFSWWGAWLNHSDRKIVIAPRRWYVNGINDSDLIPPSWIRI